MRALPFPLPTPIPIPPAPRCCFFPARRSAAAPLISDAPLVHFPPSLIPRILLGVGFVFVLEACLVALVVRVLPRTRSSAPGSSPAASPPSSSSATDLDLTRDAPDEWLASPSSDAHAQAHRGWLVLVWASVAPVPPEKPDRGERAFATLSRGVLELARDREGPVVAKIRLAGATSASAPRAAAAAEGDAGGRARRTRTRALSGPRT